MYCFIGRNILSSVEKESRSSFQPFWRYARGQTHTHTQTNRLQYSTPLTGWSNKLSTFTLYDITANYSSTRGYKLQANYYGKRTHHETASHILVVGKSGLHRANDCWLVVSCMVQSEVQEIDSILVQSVFIIRVTVTFISNRNFIHPTHTSKEKQNSFQHSELKQLWTM